MKAEKKTNKYHLTLKLNEYSNGETEPVKYLETEVSNHDELFEIIERVKNKNFFNDSEESVQFALGLKLFSEVMIKHRDHALFSELAPAFGSFMRRLKQS